MSNVVPFPTNRRIAAKAIPREEFEQLAELALDVVQRIVTLLDDQSVDTDGEDAERSLGAFEGHISQLPSFRGSDSDGELGSDPR
ncbi:hypothetical protein GOFOIKOB_3026 [Methylobacterium tardum]|uniref:Uncharacterized protein n=1 Tax=Methylobacterium tardum TaxID=374432 RepID=A0AA37TB51_9HYPH|nr:hypothetical protein [Methylobacterium tardum]URD38367.1 hypothetical protein M6G65_07960 [Methylobacterium tardum]GJE49985.1 hypothetical protein GOFOIKOB_3026 [Methylobacterium tardum]GLS70191.1 hypothetical protein GCM10007890_22040 [Methylobacterium tardum]